MTQATNLRHIQKVSINTASQAEVEEQFLKAHEQYANDILRYCYYRVYDMEKAKDTLQETFCRAWKYIINGNQIENIRALLYKIANNIIIDEKRKKKSVSLDLMTQNGFTPSFNPVQKNENALTQKELLKIVDRLDEKYKKVLVLKYVNDFSNQEISQILDEKVNNIHVRIHRGLEKVKKIFSRQPILV